MISHFNNYTKLAPTFIVAAFLASCGGGSSSSTPAATHQGIVTSVPAAAYATNPDNLSISSQITSSTTPSIRQGSGAGLLAQNASLDTAASNHAAFLVNNGLVSDSIYLNSLQGSAPQILGGHYESSVSTTGYSGASPQARAAAAGYAGTVTELMSFGAANGADCIASMENSVYHSIALVSPFIDLGIGFNAGTGSGSACAIELGVKNTTLGQLPAAAPVVYPFDTQTGVLPTFYNHAEDPVPASDLSSAGHPVVVSLYTLTTPALNGSDIAIHTFSITPSGGSAVAVRVLVNTGVTSDGPALTVDNVISSAGFVVMLPTAPLTAYTLYNLSFSATVKGQAVSKTWSFTTGAAN